jgi:uncharacterized protein (TIRG00374 family)
VNDQRLKNAVSNTKESRRKWSGKGILFGLLLLAAVIYVAMHLGEGREFLQLVRHADPFWLIVGVTYQAATYLCAGAIWWIVVKHFNFDISLGELSALSLAKLSLEKIVPAGGFGGSLLLVRSVESQGAPESVAAATLLVDVLSSYSSKAIAIVIAVAIIWTAQGIQWVVVLVCGVFILFAVVILGGIFWLTGLRDSKLPGWLRKIPVIGKVVESISEAPPEAMHSKRLFWGATGLQLLIIVLDAATLDAMLRSIGHPARFDKTFASLSIASIASMLSLIPGGLGAFEGVSILMLGLLRVPIKAGLAATLMLRAFILWLPMIPGFFILQRQSAKILDKNKRSANSY